MHHEKCTIQTCPWPAQDRRSGLRWRFDSMNRVNGYWPREWKEERGKKGTNGGGFIRRWPDKIVCLYCGSPARFADCSTRAPPASLFRPLAFLIEQTTTFPAKLVGPSKMWLIASFRGNVSASPTLQWLYSDKRITAVQNPIESRSDIG